MKNETSAVNCKLLQNMQAMAIIAQQHQDAVAKMNTSCTKKTTKRFKIFRNR